MKRTKQVVKFYAHMPHQKPKRIHQQQQTSKETKDLINLMCTFWFILGAAFGILIAQIIIYFS